MIRKFVPSKKEETMLKKLANHLEIKKDDVLHEALKEKFAYHFNT